jgi:hypothetical protein
MSHARIACIPRLDARGGHGASASIENVSPKANPLKNWEKILGGYNASAIVTLAFATPVGPQPYARLSERVIITYLT